MFSLMEEDPVEVGLPLQVVQLYLVSTSLALFYNYDLHKIYNNLVHYKIEKNSKLSKIRSIGNLTRKLIILLVADRKQKLIKYLLRIAKNVDYYHGAGCPGRYEPILPLGVFIARLHQELFIIAHRIHGYNLFEACKEWIAKAEKNEEKNFEQSPVFLTRKPVHGDIGNEHYNPSNTAVLERFKVLKFNTQCLVCTFEMFVRMK